RIKILVAQSTSFVFGGGSKFVNPACENVAFLVQAVHLIDSLGVHEISRVPAPRGVEYQVIGAGVPFVLRGGSRNGGPGPGNGQPESRGATELDEIASRRIIHRETLGDAG